MESNIKYISSSKKGIARAKNQDRTLIINGESFYLFALFDGVSSMPLSYLFAEKVIKGLLSKKNLIDADGSNLDSILFEINNETLKMGINGSCTASILFFRKIIEVVKFINVGDTRIYVFTNQFLESITKDDSIAGQDNIITKFLGKPDMTIDDLKITSFDSKYNFLLCTDGFYKLMETNLKEYFSAINLKNVQNIKRKISYLQRSKNQDDSSYILVRHEI